MSNRTIREFMPTLIVLALIGFWFYYSYSDNSKPVSGWETLSGCSEFVSLDNSKELSLFDDNRVRLNDKDGAKDRYVWGSWSYDQDTKRYSIDVNEGNAQYLMVSIPSAASTCILAAGELNAADLSNSWFSTQLD